jgi:acetyl esterase
MKKQHDNTPDPAQPWLTDFSSRHAQGKVGMQVYGKAERGAARPAIVYFHGGLFNCGRVEDAAAIAEALSAHSVVACVDYPLAPQLHFPATVEIAYEALLWVAAQGTRLGANNKHLLVAGDQAGGNLAAVVAMMARDRGLGVDHAQLTGQVLISPMLDPQQATPSMQSAADCPCRKAWSDYLGCVSNAAHPYAAPLLSRRLAGLPPALVMSADNDPLRDEAEQYAAKLIAAGVPVRVRRLGPGKGSPVKLEHPEFTRVVQTLSQFITDAK